MNYLFNNIQASFYYMNFRASGCRIFVIVVLVLFLFVFCCLTFFSFDGELERESETDMERQRYKATLNIIYVNFAVNRTVHTSALCQWIYQTPIHTGRRRGSGINHI